MVYNKTRRLIDKGLLKRVREQPCVACGRSPPSTVDHIKTRGSGGNDEIKNLWPLCWKCHDEKGKGLKKFIAKYYHLRFVLLDKGWTVSEDGKLQKI